MCDPQSPAVDKAFAPGWTVGDESVDNFLHPIDVKMKTTGRQWLDFLEPSRSHSPLLCSQRVVDSIRESHLTGYKIVEVKLHPPSGKLLNQPFAYYWLIPTAPPYQRASREYRGSEREYRFEFMFESSKHDADRVLKIKTKPEESIFSKQIPDPETWDGSDFNMFEIDRPTIGMGLMFCSSRVVELACKEKWTNIQFWPVDALVPLRINPTKTCWPPSSWYSPDEPD